MPSHPLVCLTLSCRLVSGWQHLHPLARLQTGKLPARLDLDTVPDLSTLTCLTELALAGWAAAAGGWENLRPLTRLQLLDLLGVHPPQMPPAFAALTALEWIHSSLECPWVGPFLQQLRQMRRQRR